MSNINIDHIGDDLAKAYEDGYEQGKKDVVKHGKWEEFDCEYGGIPTKGYVCSECGRVEANKEPYCHCGAEMRGE